MAEAHLYLLCTDFLFGKECRMCVAERMKTEIRGEIQPLLEIGEDMRHRCQRDWLCRGTQRAENVAILCEKNALPQENRCKRLPPCEEILHGSRGECDRAGTVCRLGRTLVLLCGAFACP